VIVPEVASATNATQETAKANVWNQLASRINPAYQCPKLRDGIVTSKLVSARGGEYYIIKSARAGTYLRLTPDEYFLLGLMDGNHQVKELVLAYFFEYRSLAFERIANLVEQLRQQRFLIQEPRDAWSGLRRHFADRTWTARVDRTLRAFISYEFPVPGIDGTVTALYRRFAWLFFTRFGLTLLALVSVAGAVIFGWEMVGGLNPLKTDDSGPGVVVFLVVLGLAVVIHELGHAVATKHYGREVRRGGFMLYYGMPVAFVDTSDIWLEPRRARIVVSLAGMIALWAAGGLAMLYVVVQPASLIASVALAFAFFALVSNTFNLMPLLELDGYYVLADWLEIPSLRARAIAFVRRDLWRKLRMRQTFNKEERIFATFGSLAMAYSLLALLGGVYFWLNHVQLFVASVFSQESAGWRPVAIAVVIVLSIALVVGVAVKVNDLRSTISRGVMRLRYRRVQADARLRSDARELLGKLRFLGDLTFAEREVLLDQVRLERFRTGEFVVRENEAGEQFYLVASGQAEVEKQDADGWPRRLTVLRRGDYFGELALLYRQPRSASVRALAPLQVLALGRESFEALVAPWLRDYGLTVRFLEQRSELSRMPVFRHTAPAELEPILDRLTAHEFASDTAIIRQGDVGDRFYLIRRGRAEVVLRDGDGVERVVRQLTAGDYFGEMALLNDSRRTATVRAVEPVSLWSLDRRAFEELLLQQLDLGATLTTDYDRRHASRRGLVAAG
jgi:CRP-like cAMP-binding protein/Zn-dependent protease